MAFLGRPAAGKTGMGAVGLGRLHAMRGLAPLTSPSLFMVGWERPVEVVCCQVMSHAGC